MRIILLLSALVMRVSLFGQLEDQTMIAKFIITDAKNNGVDITPRLLAAGAYTVFYTSGDDGLIYMANVWSVEESQSFGPIYDIDSETYEETADTYKAVVFTFRWRYTNTYDEETGTADVEVTKVYKPQGVAFTLKVITEDLDVIVYKGYMQGSIDFSIYD